MATTEFLEPQFKEDSKFKLYRKDFLRHLLQARKCETNGIIPHSVVSTLLTINQSYRDLTVPLMVDNRSKMRRTQLTVLLPYVLGLEKILIVAPSIASIKTIARGFGHFGSRSSLMYKSGLVTSELKAHTYLDRGILALTSAQLLNLKEKGDNLNLTFTTINSLSPHLSESWESQDSFKDFTTLIIFDACKIPVQKLELMMSGFNKKNIILLTPDSKKFCKKPIESFFPSHCTYY